MDNISVIEKFKDAISSAIENFMDKFEFDSEKENYIIVGTYPTLYGIVNVNTAIGDIKEEIKKLESDMEDNAKAFSKIKDVMEKLSELEYDFLQSKMKVKWNELNSQK